MNPVSRHRRTRQLAVWSGAILLLLALAGAAAAQDTEECLYCHEEADITGERDGQEISVHVDPTLFSESVHGGFDCIDCWKFSKASFHRCPLKSSRPRA